MRLFHGSNKDFNEFVISPELARHDILDLVEGYGIYMTQNIDVALSYGNLYEVEVDEKVILDTTKKTEIRKLIKRVEKRAKIDIINNIDFDDFYESVKIGKISVTEMYKEINMLLESEDSFYEMYGDRVTYEDDSCLFKQIEFAFKEAMPEVLKYYDKNLGEVYICTHNPGVLKIVNEIMKVS